MMADKATLSVGGTMMAERVARVLATAGCDPVWFVGGVHSALAETTRAMLADRHPGEGPVGGVITALAATGELAGPPRGVVVAACDLVALDAETVASVIRRVDTGPDVCVAHTDRIEPLLGWWHPRTLRRVEEAFAVGIRALHQVLAGLDVEVVDVPAPTMHNVNKHEEWAAATMGPIG
ncbi:hypothetical protein BH24ACT5_BH24ACT5_07080 [soil metagenome]